jgi:preprotein translocase subunit SecE
MSTEDLNREQKRQLKKMGALDEKGQPVRTARPTAAKKPDEERTSIPQYIREVRAEMAKVAWPDWPEVRKYAAVVLVTVLLFTGYVFGLDSLFNTLTSWLYGS